MMRSIFDQQTLVLDPEVPVMLETVEEMIAAGRLSDVPSGQRVMWRPKGAARLKSGRIRHRDVTCGRPWCNTCPHKRYAYLMYRDGKKIKSRYLGKVNFS